MRDPQNIEELVKEKIDFIGFIFYPTSKRYVGSDFKLPNIPDHIKKVGVFVNETIETVVALSYKYNLDFVQIHGDESATYCAELKKKKQNVIKAFGINNSFDFATLKAYKPFVDYFLFDTKSDSYGGTGKQFDWTLLKNYDNEIPFFLSGGISPQDVKTIKEIENINISALDLNSKFETAPGLKNIKEIRNFVTLVTIA